MTIDTALTTPKIVHVTECLAAGTMTFLIQATRELAECGVRQMLVYSRRPDTPKDVRILFDERVELVELAPPTIAYHRYFKTLRAVLMRELLLPDGVSIHLHSSKAGFLGRMALAGLKSRVPVYYSPHGLSFLNKGQPLRSLLYARLERMAAKVDSKLVGCSRSEADLLARIGARPAHVLENAVDDRFFQVQGRPEDPPLVVGMGRVCYQKAPEVFAALSARFQIAELPAKFVWIGSGRRAGEARLRAAGVHVTGWVGRDEIQRLLGAASVYVQTSRWEGMPLSVLQALAAGVPCVVTDVVGNRDAVRQGITGFVTTEADEMLIAVRRLLHDDVLRKRFSRAARQDAAERFSGASFRQRLCALYGFPERAVNDGAGVPDNLLRFPHPAASHSPLTVTPDVRAVNDPAG